MMTAMSTVAGESRASRWLVLGSFALNLFFVGAAGALAIRHYYGASSAASAAVDRTVAGRIERLAATLPTADADILRVGFRADAAKLEAAQDALNRGRENVRQSLRADPFNIDAMRTAMAEARAERQSFDLVLHETIANAAAKMSVAGRNKLADWPASRGNATRAKGGETGKK
jgi:uncharacterized membrane protein